MSRNNSKANMAKLKELFGPPPVLSTESVEAYYEMLERYLACRISISDEGEAFEEAFLELERLDRYEKQAWSLRRRSFR